MAIGISRNDQRRKTRVLVVDDEPEIREVVAALLADEGYAVQDAADGVEALNAVGRLDFDLVVSDVKMPRLDGLGLVQELRFRGYGLPVVIMSSSLPEVNLSGLTFVAKPFESSRLLGVVAAALRASRLQERRVHSFGGSRH